MRNVHDGQVKIEDGQVVAEEFFAAARANEDAEKAAGAANWVKDFEEGEQSESNLITN